MDDSSLSDMSDGRSTPDSNRASDDSNRASDDSNRARESSNRGSEASHRPRRRSRFWGDDEGGRVGSRALYSAIDLGTNNCRLLIARRTYNGFRVVDAFSRIVRLGEGMTQDGVISEAAMDRAVEALKICADKIEKRGVTCMRHVATEACRIAGNSQEFLERIRTETGLNLEIIPASEEARLAVMGCQSLVSTRNRYAMVFDIGGGSTELIWVRMRKGRQCEIHGWLSMPWGVVNLTEKFCGDDVHNSAAYYAAMRAEVQGHLQAFEDAHNIGATAAKHRVQFLGTSGTVTTLASLHLKLPRYMREKVDGAWMKAADIQRLASSVARMSFDERAAQPCIGQERADLVVAGCAILEGILSTWSVPSLRVADRGIREGILRGLMELDPPPRIVIKSGPTEQTERPDTEPGKTKSRRRPWGRGGDKRATPDGVVQADE